MEHDETQKGPSRRALLRAAGIGALGAGLAGCGLDLGRRAAHGVTTSTVAERRPQPTAPSTSSPGAVPIATDPGSATTATTTTTAAAGSTTTTAPGATTTSSAAPLPARETIVARYAGQKPSAWGMENIPGLVTRTTSPGIVLTFDACGGHNGDGLDGNLISWLVGEHLPAVLFLNSRWIAANPGPFAILAARQDLFEIGNHGTRHLPLSVDGRAAYGITGTRDPNEVYDEVAFNHELLTSELGRAPRWFRCGTAHYDDVAVRIVRDLGEVPIGFDINGDGGATFSERQVVQETSRATAGSIVIGHMNHPHGHTAAGMAAAVGALRAAGREIVRLDPSLIA